jgi:molecular chaperone GrpE
MWGRLCSHRIIPEPSSYPPRSDTLEMGTIMERNDAILSTEELPQGDLATDTATQLSAVTAERDQLLNEKSELQDRFLRRQAEFENFRRRVEREKSEFTQYAASEAVTALLPILDDFERAFKQESADKEYVRGMELIYQRLLDTLKKLGLERIESTGLAFDPYIHQAIERVESNEFDDHTVIEEFQSGYNFKGRLLRPAMVKVAVRPS